MKYNKKPLSHEQHISLLKSRGLIIPDEERAKRYLSTIGYFRLTGYMYHLQNKDGTHLFFDDITFEDIILHYQFDKKLRSLILEYLERIEVSLRAQLTNKFSIQHGFYWYIDEALYDDKNTCQFIIDEIKMQFEDPQEMFLKKFKFNYSSEHFPPSNMAMEILSLGKLTRLYNGLSNKSEKMSIAEDFGLTSTILSSWCIYLTNVRNICAHHSRLWNKRISADRPLIPKRKDYKFTGNLPDDFNTTLYGIVSIIYRMLLKINPNNSFINKFYTLLTEYPTVQHSLMGFHSGWETNPAWEKDNDHQ